MRPKNVPAVIFGENKAIHEHQRRLLVSSVWYNSVHGNHFVDGNIPNLHRIKKGLRLT